MTPAQPTQPRRGFDLGMPKNGNAAAAIRAAASALLAATRPPSAASSGPVKA